MARFRSTTGYPVSVYLPNSGIPIRIPSDGYLEVDDAQAEILAGASGIEEVKDKAETPKSKDKAATADTEPAAPETKSTSTKATGR